MSIAFAPHSSQFTHQSDAALLPCHGFRLTRGQALALNPERQQVLQLSCGKAWLTRSGDTEDYFAKRGDVLRLSAGEVWVVEALDADLRFELDAVSAPAAAPALATAAWRLVAAATGLLATGFALAERKAASMASRAQEAMKGRASMASSGGVT